MPTLLFLVNTLGLMEKDADMDDRRAERSCAGPYHLASLVLIAAIVAATSATALSPAQRSEVCASRVDAPFHHPVAGQRLQGFGLRRDPFTARLRFHSGIDYHVRRGEIVRPIGSGRVTLVDRREPGEVVVMIDHGNGLTTRYAHLDRAIVTTGACIAGERPLGTASGRRGHRQRHLHLEMRRDGALVDPLPVLERGSSSARTR